MDFDKEIERRFCELNNYAHLITKQRKLAHLSDELTQEAILCALEHSQDEKRVIRQPVAYTKALMRRFVTLPNTKFYREYVNPRKKLVPLHNAPDTGSDDLYPEIYQHTCQLLEIHFTWEDTQLFYLHLKRGWRASEISEFTGISYTMVRDRLEAIKERLKLLINEGI